MLEWVNSWPNWLQIIWFTYITFHDLIQWGLLAVFGYTVWGQRQKKKEQDALLEHIHQELHNHITEDSSFHEDLGQSGMTRGTDVVS